MNNGQEPQDIYKPSSEIVANANVKSYEEMARWAEGDLAGFWADQAEQFVWFQPWDKVLDDSNKPFYKWFVGGKTNIVYNCLDRHLETWRTQQAGADLGRRERRRAHLLLPRAQPRGVQVRQRAAQHGRQEGRPGHDLHGRACPSCPSPCWPAPRSARVHSVVYGGFSVEALHGRIEDSAVARSASPATAAA